MGKRASIKGKGMDIFIPSKEEKQEAVMTDKSHAKATFYLPQSLLDRLDLAWIKQRMRQRGLTKSYFVESMLTKELKEYEARD